MKQKHIETIKRDIAEIKARLEEVADLAMDIEDTILSEYKINDYDFGKIKDLEMRQVCMTAHSLTFIEDCLCKS